MEGRSSFLFCLCIFVLLGHRGVCALHCHRCDVAGQPLCAFLLGSDRYLQPCSEKYLFCTMQWDKSGVLKRGCTKKDICHEIKEDPEKDCCACQDDGCNWGTKSCNAQAMLYAKSLMILAFQVLLCLLRIY